MSTSSHTLFFSGGTALAPLSRELARQNLPSIHILTTFDSGGSTAELRRVFAMPAVGDLRNRLLALASPDIPPQVSHFCGHRLAGADDVCLRAELEGMGSAKAGVWQDMPEHFAKPLRRNLNYFLERMTPEFNPQGACLGNLLLAGCYMERHRELEPAMAIFSRILQCRGIVAPVVEGSFYLGARLADGRIVAGQHLFKSLPAPVEGIFLTVHDKPADNIEDIDECHPPLAATAMHYIRHARALCYPMGSFFSSVLANLLPRGTGRAIAENRGVKIFIPNSGHDPELCGLDISSQTAMILAYLKRDAPCAAVGNLLNVALVDEKNGCYPGGIGPHVKNRLHAMGVRIVNWPMVQPHNPQEHEPKQVIMALCKIIANEI